ncbi:uncharacterized protein B0I36DRAFT_404914 [Microdochium trichocladiopsis]|uniref:Clr5 domain-containing protein n=1 Tax=Microdochium trichocladiopsis TaxID=1682393 RepID=A0A9P8Y9P7_9PEZI|nr:uncharacterized protein B0I36DRAFT_404914 [Microdochium trichocladiopsis]KAH7034493.1 hypothetical protein B0I36DRAFT_404914 [Microdochium trichocladiopsis]
MSSKFSQASRQDLIIKPVSEDDWLPFKESITNRYRISTLKELMKYMETFHSFKATVDQYKSQFAKWGIDDKRIKTRGYMAILKLKREHQMANLDRGISFFFFAWCSCGYGEYQQIRRKS